MNNEARRKYANTHQHLIRSSEALLGLCSGLLADNKLNNEEIMFLCAWLDEHQDIAEYWPGDVLASRIADALKDGVITNDERIHLIDTLKSIIGGTMQETGATSGLPTSLPVNNNAVISIPNKVFCFTGTFVFGTRKKCHDIIHKLNGDTHKTVTMNVDYLVLGSLNTASWKQTSFGRKIEKAVEYQRKGANLAIVSEQHWASFI